MSASHISLPSLPSLCQKVSQSVEIFDENNFAQFLTNGVVYIREHNCVFRKLKNVYFICQQRTSYAMRLCRVKSR